VTAVYKFIAPRGCADCIFIQGRSAGEYCKANKKYLSAFNLVNSKSPDCPLEFIDNEDETLCKISPMQLLESLAQIGEVALDDEKSGKQHTREKDALQSMLNDSLKDKL